MNHVTNEASATTPNGLSAIEARLDELTDLFRRRLRDDKDKRRLIDEAHERARAAEVGPFRQFLHPVVTGVALVIDRLDAYEGTDPSFAVSIRDELLDVLARHGVLPVPDSGPVDPLWHEVVDVDGAQAGQMAVSRVVRRGFQHAGWVFRPARIIAAPLPEPDQGTPPVDNAGLS
ncbi:MAG: nucleotide exchange factor GrpE [Pseudonocardiales bacterium]|nr:nucleotide exchange factor GrpE [Pseudonocardiales bacterium]